METDLVSASGDQSYSVKLTTILLIQACQYTLLETRKLNSFKRNDHLGCPI